MVILSVEGSLRIQATMLLHSDTTRLRNIYATVQQASELLERDHVCTVALRDASWLGMRTCLGSMLDMADQDPPHGSRDN